MTTPSFRFLRVLFTGLTILTVIPTIASSQSTDDLLGFELDGPDLTQLFQDRPPMGLCPAGDGSHPEALPQGTHLLHLGVQEFYLNHRVHLALTPAQRDSLRRQRTEARRRWEDHEGRIADLEIRLWERTGAQPETLDGVAAVVLAIAGARADQRMDYVRAVSEAANLLTVSQRERLVGARNAALRAPEGK